MRSTAVCSTTSHRDLLLHLLNPYHIITAVTAPQAATQLEVGCPLLCALRDEHLAIHWPVHFASPAAGIAQVYRWYTSSRPVPNAWTNGRPPRTSSSPSPTSSPLFSVFSLSPPACLLRFCRLQLRARRQGITARRLVRGDGVPCRPVVRRRVSVCSGLVV